MSFPTPTAFRESLASQPQSQKLGIYVHIPFCWERCHFCAFYVHIHRNDHVRKFFDNLSQEISFYAKEVGLQSCSISSLYFGGGTPTTLTAEQLCRILDQFTTSFSFQSDTEISIEAHPKTMTQEGLRILRGAGFNRLSLGGQSFDNAELIRLGGRGTNRMIQDACERARSSGFDNVNLDLMYGLPGQTLDTWEVTLQRTTALQPTHISCYALTIEEGTRFYIDYKRGVLAEPNSELQNSMEDLAMGYLVEAGYQQYEISNFTKTGYACRHNLGYWRGRSYLGFGPSAQSFVHATRFGNVENLETYNRCLERKTLPIAEMDLLDPEQVVRERVAFGLRLVTGAPFVFGQNGELEKCLRHVIPLLMARGLLYRRKHRLVLTKQGRRFADSVGEAIYGGG